MKRCIIIPDSYKGTMSALEFCRLGREAVLRRFPACEVLCIPVADGGEGTVDCFAEALGAQRFSVSSAGPWGERTEAQYARSGDTAFVEMAQNAGLPMVGDRKDPGQTTTYGVGEVIRAAVKAGCGHIVLGLGGSCTNDAGTGAACALGARFYRADGETFLPTGDTLGDIASYDTATVRELLDGCRITAMCDIDNVMYGPQGAAAVFAPQKGADGRQVERLDAGLRSLGRLMERQSGRDIARMPGSGAAGAFGAGVAAFLGGELRSGIETVLDCVGFDHLLEGTDMVFTGEGCIDGQSLRGKVVSGVARRAKARGVPVTVVAGAVGDGAEGAYELGVSGMFSINRRAEDFSVSKFKTKENFSAAMDAILGLLAAWEQR